MLEIADLSVEDRLNLKDKLLGLKSKLNKSEFVSSIHSVKTPKTSNTIVGEKPVYDRLYHTGILYRENQAKRQEHFSRYDATGRPLFQPQLVHRRSAHTSISKLRHDTVSDYLYLDALKRDQRMQQRVRELDSEAKSVANQKKMSVKSGFLLYRKAEREAAEMFEYLDTDGDGYVRFADLRRCCDVIYTAAELKLTLAQLRDGGEFSSVAERLWSVININGGNSDSVSYLDFVRIALPHIAPSEEEATIGVMSSDNMSIVNFLRALQKLLINQPNHNPNLSPTHERTARLTTRTSTSSSKGRRSHSANGAATARKEFHPEISERSKRLAENRLKKEEPLLLMHHLSIPRARAATEDSKQRESPVAAFSSPLHSHSISNAENENGCVLIPRLGSAITNMHAILSLSSSSLPTHFSSSGDSSGDCNSKEKETDEGDLALDVISNREQRQVSNMEGSQEAINSTSVEEKQHQLQRTESQSALDASTGGTTVSKHLDDKNNTDNDRHGQQVSKLTHHSRLYLHAQLMSQQKEVARQEHTRKLQMECTFKPKILRMRNHPTAGKNSCATVSADTSAPVPQALSLEGDIGNKETRDEPSSTAALQKDEQERQDVFNRLYATKEKWLQRRSQPSPDRELDALAECTFAPSLMLTTSSSNALLTTTAKRRSLSFVFGNVKGSPEGGSVSKIDWLEKSFEEAVQTQTLRGRKGSTSSTSRGGVGIQVDNNRISDHESTRIGVESGGTSSLNSNRKDFLSGPHGDKETTGHQKRNHERERKTTGEEGTQNDDEQYMLDSNNTSNPSRRVDGLHLDLKIGSNKTVTLFVNSSDDPEKLAVEICDEHRLSLSAAPLIADVIRQNFLAAVVASDKV